MTRQPRKTAGWHGAFAGLVMVAVAACGGSDPAKLEVRPLPVPGADVAARFQLKNVGAMPLELDDVVPACGCVPASRLPKALAPGAVTALDVACRTAGGPGAFVRELRLRSSDPSRPETPLPVPAAVGGAGPAAVYLGYVAVGASVARDVVLTGAVPAPSSPELVVEALPARPDGARGLRVRFTPRAAGIMRATLALGPGAGSLPVTAVAYDRIAAFPPEIRVPRTSGAPGLPSIMLVARDGAPLAIDDVDYPAGISGELRTVVPGTQFRLVLRGRVPPGTTDAAIRVRGRGAAEALVVIPVVDGHRPSA